MSGVTLLRMHELCLGRPSETCYSHRGLELDLHSFAASACSGLGLLPHPCLCFLSWIFVTAWEEWSIMAEKMRICAHNGPGTSTRVAIRIEKQPGIGLYLQYM